mgnify:CR=1 FL=1
MPTSELENQDAGLNDVPRHYFGLDALIDKP